MNTPTKHITVTMNNPASDDSKVFQTEQILYSSIISISKIHLTWEKLLKKVLVASLDVLSRAKQKIILWLLWRMLQLRYESWFLVGMER